MSSIDRIKSTLALDENVSSIKGVSSVRKSILLKLDIRSVGDLVQHYPKRYIDLSRITTVASAPIGSFCTISGEIADLRVKHPRKDLSITEITINDGTATLIASYFRQPWLAEKYQIGQEVVVAGFAEFNFGFLRMKNPYMESFDSTKESLNTGRIVPVHPATAKLSAPQMRKIIAAALNKIHGVYDPLPLDTRVKHSLMSKGNALRAIHFPRSMKELHAARYRLAFEELLMIQLQLIQTTGKRRKNENAVAHTTDGVCVKALQESLPFQLTSDQKRAISDVFKSLSRECATNRMILGDVGTGKTIVAAFAICAAKDSKTQAILMAPTEVLSRQHFATLSKFLQPLGISCACLTGSTPKSERLDITKRYSSGEIDLLIGTHALLEKDVLPCNLSLVIIDEQQRFGVEHRLKLIDKGDAPDVLSLTATPIPRSLAIALFGGIELSYIKEKPVTNDNRKTHVLPKSLIGKAYDVARRAVRRKERVFVVCPLKGVDKKKRDELASKDDNTELDDANNSFSPDVIIDSEGDYTRIDTDVARAAREARFLQDRVFIDSNVGLLHGSMKPAEKNETMERFRDGEIDVLVCTTVIEVGIDIPQASVMIIEDADRFGLAQLHQLRGRVGRSNLDSKVFLISSSESYDAISRLDKMQECDDGYELASFDLSLRHEGDLLGNRQSGMPTLKLVNLSEDNELIECAHKEAMCILDDDPTLSSPKNAALLREMRVMLERWGK